MKFKEDYDIPGSKRRKASQKSLKFEQDIVTGEEKAMKAIG